jgi:hypothetical protein
VNMTALPFPPCQRRLTAIYATTALQCSTKNGASSGLQLSVVVHPPASTSFLMLITGLKRTTVVAGMRTLKLKSVPRSDAVGFEALPKHCTVERTSRGPAVAVNSQKTSSTTHKLSSHVSTSDNSNYAQATRGKCLVMNPHFPDRHQ